MHDSTHNDQNLAKGLGTWDLNITTIFNNMLSALALHEIICDDNGTPINYRFLAINPAFERMTGLGQDIVGQTVLDVLPDTEPHTEKES